MKISIKLPKNRVNEGLLQVMNDDAVLAEFPCLGKADNGAAKLVENLDRNPLKPFGDTPLGTWTAEFDRGIGLEERTYGEFGVFKLTPTSGDALTSHQPPYNRKGIWIHGGVPGIYGNLRPTYGCIRVRDKVIKEILNLIKIHGPISSVETVEV